MGLMALFTLARMDLRITFPISYIHLGRGVGRETKKYLYYHFFAAALTREDDIPYTSLSFSNFGHRLAGSKILLVTSFLVV
jgi:hypothetical protein